MNQFEKEVRDCLNVDYVQMGWQIARFAGLEITASKATKGQLRALARAWDRLHMSSKRSELHHRKEILFDLWAASVNK